MGILTYIIHKINTECLKDPMKGQKPELVKENIREKELGPSSWELFLDRMQNHR